MENGSKTIDDIDDCLYLILSHLSFTEKVCNRRVCKKWQQTLNSLLKLQRSLGNEETKVVNRCSNATHWVSKNDLVSKSLLTNLSVLPIILRLCPELKAIAITNVDVKIFEETAEEKRAADRRHDDDEDDDDVSLAFYREYKEYLSLLKDREEKMVALDQEARRRFRHMICDNFDAEPDRVIDRIRERRHYLKMRCRRPPSPRRCNEEDFLAVLAKYAPKLECIDISGLRLLSGSIAHSQAGGSWHQIGIECGERLRHIRTYHLTDSQLTYLFQHCPNISDIGAATGIRGNSLNMVKVDFERLAIYCLRLHGLETFASAGLNALNVKTMALNNVNKDIIRFICSTFLSLEKVSFRLQVASLTAKDLSRISNLRYLKRLSLKRRESKTLTNFDEPFTGIMQYCNQLSCIILKNLYVTDASVKLLSAHCHQLKELTICYSGCLNQNMLISDVSIQSLANLNNLVFLKLDYPNTITENGVIGYLIATRHIETLKIGQCREFIPDPSIVDISVQSAKSHPERILRVYISTKEKIEIHCCDQRLIRNIIPPNLFISITTGIDIWKTDYCDESSDDDESEADIGKIFFDWED